MPGSELCGRCGSSLRLTSTLIDVHPPRAGRWTKRVRRMTPRVPVNNPATAAIRNVTDRATAAFFVRLDDSTPVFPLLLRSPFPGWPQLYTGSRVLGRIFLYTWLLLLSVWLLFFYGTTFGSMILGLAFSTHSSSVADATNRILQPTSMRRRMAYSLCTSALLAGFVYVPAGRVLFRYADPVVMQLDLFPFRQGDVLLVNHSAFARSAPRPGQVVLFTPENYRVGGDNHRYTLYVGPRIDRIIAGPGDHVRWVHRSLLINGRPSPHQPLNPSLLPAKPFELTVPGDSYLILPTTTPAMNPNTAVSTWVGMAKVPRNQIEGTVYMISHPLSHIRWLH